MLKPQLAGSIGSERFLREIRLTAKLQHPHILPVHDSGVVDQLLYYVMPYVEGESLRERLDREKQLPIEDAVRITREVSEALDYALSQGVIHRDIKPANILLSAGQAVVEASVFRAGDSVRIHVQLIQAFPEERDLWAQEYDRDVSDVLEMHSDVARTIAEKIDVAMTPEEETRLGGARTVNPETYEAYLKGMYHLNKSTPEDVRKGLAYLQEALDINPADPMANAGLALGYATVGHGPAPPPDAWPRARAAAERALKLDSTLGEAHAAMADVKLYYEWDRAGAEQAFLRANELNPSLAMNHFHHAWYLALVGRLDEAIGEHERAQELDPLTPALSANLGWLYLYAGRTDAALTESQKAIDLDPNSAWGFLTLGTAYSFKGMHDESIAALEKAVAISPLWKWALGRGYAVAGRRDEARKIAAELEAQETNSMGALGLVVLYTALGENDAAFRWLAYEPPHAWVPWLAVDPVLVAPRDDPRFQDFLRRLKLPSRPE